MVVFKSNVYCNVNADLPNNIRLCKKLKNFYYNENQHNITKKMKINNFNY